MNLHTADFWGHACPSLLTLPMSLPHYSETWADPVPLDAQRANLPPEAQPLACLDRASRAAKRHPAAPEVLLITVDVAHGGSAAKCQSCDSSAPGSVFVFLESHLRPNLYLLLRN